MLPTDEKPTVLTALAVAGATRSDAPIARSTPALNLPLPKDKRGAP
jgi:hypothetical protein